MPEKTVATSAPIRASFANRSLVAPVLERIVSAAAVQAELSVDRLVNALAAVDVIVSACNRVFAAEAPREFSIAISPGKLQLSVDALHDGQADALLDAARLPEIGDVLARVADSIQTEQGQNGNSLSVTLC